MRIAHATDIHWFVPPTPRQLGFKRVLGTANLYLRGRRHHFDRGAQRALVAHLRRVEADLILITGDLTAQALPAEFENRPLRSAAAAGRTAGVHGAGATTTCTPPLR